MGYRLEPVEQPPHIEVHSIGECQPCHAEVAGVAVRQVAKRQVVDLPKVKLAVTEQQAEVKQCPVCGAINRAAFPEGITQPRQYGPRVCAHRVYFNVYPVIRLERTAEVVGELYGQPICDGTIVAAAIELAGRVEGVNEHVKAYLMQTETPVHFDETGVRVTGKLTWVHPASTEQATD